MALVDAGMVLRVGTLNMNSDTNSWHGRGWGSPATEREEGSYATNCARSSYRRLETGDQSDSLKFSKLLFVLSPTSALSNRERSKKSRLSSRLLCHTLIWGGILAFVQLFDVNGRNAARTAQLSTQIDVPSALSLGRTREAVALMARPRISK